ncbi:glucokinase [Saccharopolyspora erythraea NRRL 2338]|uniref:Glucokinase n=2 Tax=Saccharopolyspora erythraea TaxID=1836 RepID=A4FAE3_SACEN|nr:ROK family glucokinase [Saccharopolyspora erythraea]EQD86394.1 glucokinase [Saccharopolyspora erythraea D]PFG94804.1 glucokinase [Saccharopolyspora erythraea NRRL 2338]QRK91519.1 ROK family glucokinase [Saccharopolyspora erythraea]CAM01018.1 glucokinase, transcriptional regulator [Saccharopolyspora erythraea NRRL 2338]
MLTVGVDVGGTSVRASVVDPRGAVLDTLRVPTPDTGEELDSAIADVVRGLALRHPVAAVGLAVAGFVSEDRRVVRFAPHLAWRHVAVADRIAARVELPVVLEHDANAAAIAEQRFGAAAGARVAALVALGTGIGGALVIDGEVFRGAYGVAPELGHLRLVPDGRPCPCGKRGCWERYCSGTALVSTVRELQERGDGTAGPLLDESTPLTGVRVARAAEEGDPLARRAMRELARWLGEGLALVADVYDPEVVVIAGGVSGSAHLFLGEARKHYAKALTGAGHRPLARIAVAKRGDDAGMVGAATLAREHVVAHQVTGR